MSEMEADNTVQVDLIDTTPDNGPGEMQNYTGTSVNLGSFTWLCRAALQREKHTSTVPAFNGASVCWYRYRAWVVCRAAPDVRYWFCPARVSSLRRRARPDTSGDGESNHEWKVDEVVEKLFRPEDCQYSCSICEESNWLAGMKKNFYMKFKIELIPGAPSPASAPSYSFLAEPYHDVEIVLDNGDVISTSKAILAMSSPFFQTMLYGPFKEKNSKSVKLHEVEPSEFRELLLHLYPFIRKPVHEENLECLLNVADKLCVTSVTQDCEKFLLTVSEDRVSLTDKLRLADQYCLHSLKWYCNVDKDSRPGRRQAAKADRIDLSVVHI